jgi:ferredoxin-thioredoxin reductase catalytic subunit
MSHGKKTVSDTREFVAAVAAKQGWQVNPDSDFVGQIVAGLTRNHNRYGYYLCPCRDGDGRRDLDKDIVCPCEYNLQDQVEHGHCYCGLFLSEEFAASGRTPESIPERRPGGIWT